MKDFYLNVYSMSLRILICSSTCILLACGGGGDGGSSNPCGDLNIRVTGGTQCRFERSPVVLVVAVDSSGSPLEACSGTMVTVDDVLTAAHCFLNPNTAGVVVIADQRPLNVTTGAIHPLYSGVPGSPFDVAMLTIESPLSISPVPVILGRNVAIGDQLTVFGYGKNEKGETVEQLGLSALKGGYMKIADIRDGLVFASFDDTGTSVCSGDSGGPATYTFNGVTGIVGITSFGSSQGCESGSFAAFVDMQINANIDFVLGYAPDVAAF